MEDCNYTEVKSECESELIRNNTQWKLVLRQLAVSSGVWVSMLTFGFIVGAPTVYIPQLKKEANSTSAITEDVASWLTSLHAISGFSFVFIMSIVTYFIGRKLSFLIAAVDALVSFILLYYSSSVTHIMISTATFGLFAASQMVISISIMTEYTSPKYRGIFLTIKSATFYWGVWIANAIGTFFHWKNIALLGIICAVYNLLIVFIWPESPYWLASKGKFKECVAAHRWLRGSDKESEKELQNLIRAHEENIQNDKAKVSLKEKIVIFYKLVKSKEFCKPTFISIVTCVLLVFCGKPAFTGYSLDILKRITHSESTAYIGMLILDGVTVFSMYLGTILAKFVKRRTLLLVSSCIGVLFLFILSLYLYLIKLDVITDNKYVSLFLLTVFSIAISCGPLITSYSMYGELMPIKARNFGIFVIALAGKLSIAVVVKTAPLVIRTLGLHGLCLTYGVSSSVIIFILYKYLPETKDKTLQEIVDSMIGVEKKDSNVLKPLVIKNSE